ncbi:hepatic triacylglycerol lipase [Pontoporia blainvillei]|uniref:Hepatic triacylglycerol lipase n=1 Tax=Pontoporia blainvillei TaxID=48723 RepID=A0ABX0RZ06_PONBL|nr:hepatic triacylglycerol lipase [Pontoporia blainvillei]
MTLRFHPQMEASLENWIWQMVAALKSQVARPVNVGLAEWVTLAHTHYSIAVRNTRLVGQEIAALLQWLEQERVYFQPIVLKAQRLDAAGLLFKRASPSDRLSPDDANFVDAIHTFTQEHMGLSVGIKQPIAHYDFYPNGGSYQPGCHFLELYKHIAKHGLNVSYPIHCSQRVDLSTFLLLPNVPVLCTEKQGDPSDEGTIRSFLPCLPAITQTIKCAHERSVHLFIDSLLHADMQSTAYPCRDMDSFSQGLCLSCKKGRCNTLGYYARREQQSKKSKSLFLVTRAQSPFKGPQMPNHHTVLV